MNTDACIVLSTFWRHFRDYISYVLDRHGIPPDRIIGSTPGYNKSMVGRKATDEQEYSSRADEILSWIQTNRGQDYKHFVILDDRPSAADNSPYLQDRFVQCQTSLGLTYEDVTKAIAILNGNNVTR